MHGQKGVSRWRIAIPSQQACHSPVWWYFSHRLIDKLVIRGADKLSMGHSAVLRRTEPMVHVCAPTTRWCHILGTNTHQPVLSFLNSLCIDMYASLSSLKKVLCLLRCHLLLLFPVKHEVSAFWMKSCQCLMKGYNSFLICNRSIHPTTGKTIHVVGLAAFPYLYTNLSLV